MHKLMMDLKDIIRPFAEGRYVSSWEQNANKVSAISDYLEMKVKETPFVEDYNFDVGRCASSDALLKNVFFETMPSAMEATNIDYLIDYQTPGKLDRFHQIFRKVASVEKLAMSACSFALSNFQMPPELVSGLCHVIYEEALHLKGISRLMVSDESVKPWIEDSRTPAWELIQTTESISDYMFLEHCLYEGEGCIAAGKAYYEMQQAGEDLGFRVTERICKEETNHALFGYKWIHMLGIDETKALAWVQKFLEVECSENFTSFKRIKTLFSLYLVREYLRNRDYYWVRDTILENVNHAKKFGALLVDQEVLDEVEANFMVRS